MENSKGSKGIYEQMKDQATVYDPSKVSFKDILKALDEGFKREAEYRRKYPPVMELPMCYALALDCERLKAYAESKHNYHFIGGLKDYEELTKKCDDCGIKH